jgi:hypothetical protein
MEGQPKRFKTHDDRDITSLDDLPRIAKLAERQRLLNKWYGPIAMAPFVVMIIFAVGIFPNSRNPFLYVLVFASLLWAMFIAGYAFYLLFFFRCPSCERRYGLGDRCRTCGLPRHIDSPQTLFADLS